MAEVEDREFRTKTIFRAHCDDCDETWETRNAHGIAVQHARKYGHYVSVERTIVYVYNYSGRKAGG